MGIFTEPLPNNNKGIFTEPLPSNDRKVGLEVLKFLGFHLALTMGFVYFGIVDNLFYLLHTQTSRSPDRKGRAF
jgi:hypothetical protein